MNFTNKHIILMILTIIILTFVYNYDVYIVEKNQPICKPIYVTKRILTPDMEEKLLENGISLQEPMNLIDEEVIEGFNTLIGQTLSDNMNTPGHQLSTFIVSGVVDKKKMKVMDSTIKVLANIPTTFNVPTIKQMVEYFGMIYETSPTLGNFYQNVASSTKIKEQPYNSKYAQLILFLIGKFNNDIENCIEKPSEKCGFLKENYQQENSSTIPEYLQESSEKKLIPKIVNKLVPKVANELTNELAQEIRSEIIHDINKKLDNVQNKDNFTSHSSCSSCSSNSSNPYKIHPSANSGYSGEIPNRGLLPAKPFSLTDYNERAEPETCFNKCNVKCPVNSLVPTRLKPEEFGIIEPQDNSMNYYSSFN